MSQEYPEDVQQVLALKEAGVKKVTYQPGGLHLELSYVERIGLEEQIDVERVAQEIGIGWDDVQAALRKLHKADIVDRISWTLYQGPRDPMLRRYIEYNYRCSEKDFDSDWFNLAD
ncbi:MAG: hypothetical protein ACE5GO_08525, partial [Anaerolineales bacterium]